MKLVWLDDIAPKNEVEVCIPNIIKCNECEHRGYCDRAVKCNGNCSTCQDTSCDNNTNYIPTLTENQANELRYNILMCCVEATKGEC